MHKTVSILGSTGSIGTQALDVISRSADRFKIIWLTTNSRIELLAEQCSIFNPKGVVIANENAYNEFKKISSFKGEILCGNEALDIAASDDLNNLVISSLVGYAGVAPTLAAIRKGIDIALANKETLVSAGSLITNEAKKHSANIIAVDSEHNAILQCLIGEKIDEVDKLILTASGGPFRTTPIEDFKNITVDQALKHPNWSMGSKITIDSASMMNKGLEVIEAFWLFSIPASSIDVVVHPQSIIHSMVQFIDTSVKAQLGLPDMRVPISYALSYPKRFDFDFPKLDLTELGTLNFEKPDLNKFKCLQLAFDVINNKPEKAVLLNAANEVAVSAFLNKQIKFVDIANVIDDTLQHLDINELSIDDITHKDAEARNYSMQLITDKYAI